MGRHTVEVQGRADDAPSRPADDVPSRPVDDVPRRPDGGRTPLPHGSSSFALFGELVVVGLAVALLSVPVVTLLPALAAGVVHLRRHLAGEGDRVVDLLRLFVEACRGVWLVAVGAAGAALLLGFNVWLWRSGSASAAFQVPGLVSAVLLAVLAVVLLRSAGGWAPGERWWPVVRAAAGRTGTDLRGTVMLLVALGLVIVIVWMLLPLVLVVGGLLALAVLAVERHARR